MKVWVNTSFEGHWPFGTAAVVTADTVDEAVFLLRANLEKRGLGSDVCAEQFEEINLNIKASHVLRDGDY